MNLRTTGRLSQNPNDIQRQRDDNEKDPDALGAMPGIDSDTAG